MSTPNSNDPPTNASWRIASYLSGHVCTTGCRLRSSSSRRPDGTFSIQTYVYHSFSRPVRPAKSSIESTNFSGIGPVQIHRPVNTMPENTADNDFWKTWNDFAAKYLPCVYHVTQMNEMTRALKKQYEPRMDIDEVKIETVRMIDEMKGCIDCTRKPEVIFQ